MSIKENFDFLIVGAGFAGLTLAERLASQFGKRCLVVDRRKHIGGNSADWKNKAGVRIHPYGPHYFRTDSDAVRDYLSQFTEWQPVKYKILAYTDQQYWPFPINLNTFEQFIGKKSTSEEMKATLAQWRMPIEEPKNSEEVILSQVGARLYEKFFKNYTRKQWGLDPRELDASVCRRIPIRTNRDNRYLSEKFQALPKDGYSAMFERMAAHPNIQVELETDFRDAQKQVEYSHLIYTGMIDEFYNFCFGALPYRSLRFEPETLQQEFFQSVVQVNYPNEHDFTRIVEIKHATGQKISATTIIREYPEPHEPGKEAYYPIPAANSRALYQKYKQKAQQETGVSFIGRLATYQYLNMDQVVALALKKIEEFGQNLQNAIRETKF